MSPEWTAILMLVSWIIGPLMIGFGLWVLYEDAKKKCERDAIRREQELRAWRGW